MACSMMVDGVKYFLKGDALVVVAEKPLKVLSDAVLGGGLRRASYIVNYHLRKPYRKAAHARPKRFLRKVINELGLPVADTVGLMTAADVKKAVAARESSETVTVAVVATAGVSNAARAGDEVSESAASTINVVVVIDANLSDAAMVNALQTATEAKGAALSDLDIRSVHSLEAATGTTTDTTVIACTKGGEKVLYAGTGTELGAMVSRAVKVAVYGALVKGEGMPPGRPLVERLKERRVRFGDLLDTGLELFVPHPGASVEEARRVLAECLGEAMRDPNVAALVMAAARLEDDAKKALIPGLPASEYLKDPVHLVADELIGMAIANYIAGSRGLFEYVRFERSKPGILKRLGPFMDDAIAALIAGSSSLMYSKLAGKRKS